MARIINYINLIDNLANVEVRRRKHNITENVFELSDFNFIKLFRLNKEQVISLIDELHALIEHPRRRSAITIRTKLLTSLRCLASGSYQLDIGRNQALGMSQPSVSRCLHFILDALNNQIILNRYICFPNNILQLQEIRQRFFDMYGFPGIVGLIDCTHIAIVCPIENEHIFVNRKGYHSLNVEVICDERMRIIHVNARYPGSTHDSFIWRNSNVENFLSNLPQDQRGNFYLLGDSGYPVRPWMMTPILPEPEADTPEARYNSRMRYIRSGIERCFGLLKNRFRCLLKDRTLHYSPQTSAQIINACCVLHNICIENNIPFYDDMVHEEIIPMQIDLQPHIPDNEVAEGRGIRQHIVNNYFA